MADSPALDPRVATALRIAHFFRYVRESGGENHGPTVEAFLKLCGLGPGYPWCLAFVSSVLFLTLGPLDPLPMTAGCDVDLEWGKAHHQLHLNPEPGDIFLLLRTETDAHHAGFVVAVHDDTATFDTIEGNTNTDGSDNGIGVFERTRDRSTAIYVFLRWRDVMGTTSAAA